MKPWINLNEDYWDYEYQPMMIPGSAMVLAVRTAVHDNRDAIIGWKYHPAPPAQQYGWRMSVWIQHQAIDAQIAAAAPNDQEEPF